jgi:hypothetical protein
VSIFLSLKELVTREAAFLLVPAGRKKMVEEDLLFS